MNLAHIHLILNHIPIVGIPVAIVFLAIGFLQKNSSTQRIALFVLIGLAAVALPVYFTGEPAEEVVEHLPGVAESFIEAHEDAAKISLIATLIAGAAAFIAIWFQKDPKKSRVFNLGVLGLACIAAVSLFYTANLGGQIRHTEFRADSVIQGSNDVKGETESGKDKDDD